jgi:hypothetical protein
LALYDDPSAGNCSTQNDRSRGSFQVDREKVDQWLRTNPIPAGAVRQSIDPVTEYFAKVLDCPRKMLAHSRETALPVSLDSTCNL